MSVHILAGSRLKLVCVGPTEVLDASPLGTGQVYRLALLADDDMEVILRAADRELPQEIVNVCVRISGGYVKLALYVAQTLKQQNVPVVELRRITDIRQFLKKFVPTGPAQTLRALSLLSRVGWEGDVGEEAKALATALDLPYGHLRKDRLRRRIRGRSAYVSESWIKALVSSTASLPQLLKTSMLCC